MSVFLNITYGLLWGAVVVQGFLIATLVYQLAELRHAVDQVHISTPNPFPIASDAPTFSAADLRTGKSISSASLVGRSVAILFLSTDCTMCRGLARDLKKLHASNTEDLLIYCNGAARGCQSLLASDSSLRVIRKETESVAGLFGLHGFPALVLINPSWKIVAFRYPTRVSEILAALETLARGSDDMQVSSALAKSSA